MAKENVEKILQTKLALSSRALRLGEASRLSILEAIKAINSEFKTPAQRRAIANGKAIECRGYRTEGDLVGIYLVGFVPDEAVGIIPHNQEDLSLLPPPENADFLDGELMALISDETVIVCRLGLFESALNNYIEYLGPKANLDKEDASFFFKNRTDIDKLQLIQQDGVASIRFEGAANAASVEYVKSEEPKSFVRQVVGTLWSEVEALTYADKAAKPGAENLKVEVYLKYDKRTGTSVDQEELQEIAEQVAETDGGFQIKTLSGRTINPTDVLLNKKVRLQKYGKSVTFNDVFAEMVSYYKELTKPGGDGDEE